MLKPQIPINELQDFKMSLGSLHQLLTTLIKKYGPEAVLRCDAGYNNVSFYLERPDKSPPTSTAAGKSNKKKFLVVRSDNYGRSGEQPGYDEKIMFEGPFTNEEAARISKLLNDQDGLLGPYYYRSRPIGYKPHVFNANA